MCTFLNKENNKLLEAEKDIRCYKVIIEEITDKGTEYISDLMHFPYELNVLQHSHITMKPDTNFKNLWVISDGFHSFANISSAIVHKLDEEKFGHEDYRRVIVECTIPKGSQYYKGYYHFEVYEHQTNTPTLSISTYVSDSIIIKKIITQDKIPFPYQLGDCIKLTDLQTNKIYIADIYKFGRNGFSDCLNVHAKETTNEDDLFCVKVDIDGKSLDDRIIIEKVENKTK